MEDVLSIPLAGSRLRRGQVNRVMPNGLRRVAWAFAFLFSAGLAHGQSNLLLNPGFESGSTFPSSWSTFGTGSFVWQLGGAHSGVRSMNLGGSSFALMYQRVSGVTGRVYRVKAWVKRDTGPGAATLKIEFHNAAVSKISEEALAVIATDTWTEYGLSAVAPAGTALVTASIVGEEGGTVLFDDVSIVEQEVVSNSP